MCLTRFKIKMDKEAREFLENMMGQINSRFESMETELKSFRQETNNRFDNLESGQKEIKTLVE